MRSLSNADECEPFLNPAKLCRKVNLSRSQIYRLETAGEFPARHRFGDRKVFWATKSVLTWMQARLDARAVLAGAPRTIVMPNDRFVGKSGLRFLIPLSDRQISRLEAEGRFPKRLPLGSKRVAWLEREIFEWIATRALPLKARSISKETFAP